MTGIDGQTLVSLVKGEGRGCDGGEKELVLSYVVDYLFTVVYLMVVLRLQSNENRFFVWLFLKYVCESGLFFFVCVAVFFLFFFDL